MTLEAVVFCLVALKTARTTLRTDPVHIKVVRRAIVQALSIKEQRQWGSVARIALQAGTWLVKRTVPARPVTVACDTKASCDYVNHVVLFSQCEHLKGVSDCRNLAIVQALELYVDRGAASDGAMWIDVFEAEGVSIRIKAALNVTEWRRVDPAAKLIHLIFIWKAKLFWDLDFKLRVQG